MNWYTDAPISRAELAAKVTGLNGVTKLWGGTSAQLAADLQANGYDPSKTYVTSTSPLPGPGVAGFTQRWMSLAVPGSAGTTVRSLVNVVPGGLTLTEDGRATPFTVTTDTTRYVDTPNLIDNGYGSGCAIDGNTVGGAFTMAVVAAHNTGGGAEGTIAHGGLLLTYSGGATTASLTTKGGGTVTSAPSLTGLSAAGVNSLIFTWDGASAVTLKGNSGAPVAGTIAAGTDYRTILYTSQRYVDLIVWPTALSTGDQATVYTALKAAYPTLP